MCEHAHDAWHREGSDGVEREQAAGWNCRADVDGVKPMRHDLIGRVSGAARHLCASIGTCERITNAHVHATLAAAVCNTRQAALRARGIL
jgi:hypothetical protein